MSSIGHKDLENVRVRSYHNDSILTGTEIQPILDNSPNLKTFVFYGFQSKQTVDLSLANHSLLSKVKLLHWKGSSSTIDSLINCKTLKELVIDYTSYSSHEIKESLSKDHTWDLKRLELKRLRLCSDKELNAITKKLPNLEYLDIKLEDVSDNGMEMLGKNCPNLKVLKFSNESLTNLGLAKLTQNLPHLEVLSFDSAFDITEEGIKYMAQNCKKLRLIQVMHYKKIEKSGIDALIQNCPDLKGIQFGHGGPLSLEDIGHLVEQKPKLHYVELYNIMGIQEEELENFYQKFTQVSKIPCILSIKKLYSLVV